MAMILQAIVSFALAYLIWSIVCLEINVHKARALNVPVVRVPVDPVNFLWVFLQSHVWGLLDRLPIQWSSYPDFIRFTYRGWHFREKSNSAVRLGPVWALVTPVTFYLQVAEPHAIELLEVYGPCISTAGWDDWARHRKVLAAPFNESVMRFVWGESLRQATAMLRSWTGATQRLAGIPSVQKDTRTLSLNVLAATGFRKSYDFHGSADPAAQDEAGSYRDDLQTVLDNAILIMLIPYKYLQGSLVPKKLVRVANAARSFKTHMVKMLEDGTSALRENRPGSGGIMSAFVRALDVHIREVVTQPTLKESKDGKKGLSVDEIFGNLFVINFAGHDTTANTLAFSMLLLAAHPEVQAWLAEEVASIQAAKDTPVEQWDYNAVFPRLKRCQAVLLETLRVYPPIMSLPKWTKERAQTLRVGEQTLVIPPGVGTSPNLLAMHTHPKYWKDPFAWKPARWIVAGPRLGSDAGEELWTPAAHTYFPWSDGPQNCPGAKFSKVEAVAVLACISKDHRLGIQKESGEDEETARKRITRCINDVNLEILLRMRDADRVNLVCTEA
ncbi:hypothetical protein VPNG_00168 [Cytospora leucostoma]|uniref:Cytochrome P450 n=1 Tax=Cytospora leucostoma TaxID=1230097 RepID=A0A423XPE7_9PEZI|nr:hypothetical protein VPNG_00168 [Cytospora leucostoma]